MIYVKHVAQGQTLRKHLAQLLKCCDYYLPAWTIGHLQCIHSVSMKSFVQQLSVVPGTMLDVEHSHVPGRHFPGLLRALQRDVRHVNTCLKCTVNSAWQVVVTGGQFWVGYGLERPYQGLWGLTSGCSSPGDQAERCPQQQCHYHFLIALSLLYIFYNVISIYQQNYLNRKEISLLIVQHPAETTRSSRNAPELKLQKIFLVPPLFQYAECLWYQASQMAPNNPHLCTSHPCVFPSCIVPWLVFVTNRKWQK